eukprot:TRINITY_DN1327_c4_g1_i1.p6 TRINITY_DN1327_c4_g1~~TRINITY_DN1327_c4_g1_i1.p6  ORF type:complete len:123 (+),score=1.35 TRINITY_DN1327_c4_g1_i1:296-664(+)
MAAHTETHRGNGGPDRGKRARKLQPSRAACVAPPPLSSSFILAARTAPQAALQLVHILPPTTTPQRTHTLAQEELKGLKKTQKRKQRKKKLKREKGGKKGETERRRQPAQPVAVWPRTERRE